jgi:hypothetical protein
MKGFDWGLFVGGGFGKGSRGATIGIFTLGLHWMDIIEIWFGLGFVYF